MDRISLPDGVKTIIDMLEEHGYEAYAVGGCVRDSLLEIKPKDWDLCTSALPSQILKCFGENQILKTAEALGAVTVLMPDGQYEVTTFRDDGTYTDGRHPDSVQFVQELDIDLARRDFTINAMAYKERTGVIDLFGGREDLKKGVIACVGDAEKRFSEDALRILRAVRFASVYDFEIEEKTSAAIHRRLDALKQVSSERINSELCKLLHGKGCARILMEYRDIIAEIIPEMSASIDFDQNSRYHIYTVYDHIVYAVDSYKGEDTVVKLAIFLHDIGKPYCYTYDEKGGHFRGHAEISRKLASQVLERLRFDKKTIQNVLELILYHDSTMLPSTKTIRRWVNKIGVEQTYRLLDVRMADIVAHSEVNRDYNIRQCNQLRDLLEEVLTEEQCFSLRDMKINGRDIMELGVPQGTMVGKILKNILESILAGNLVNERDILLDAAKREISREYGRE